jgi:hypothetical protein
MSQTSYLTEHPEAMRGLKVDTRFDHVASGLNWTGAGIPVGRGVVRDLTNGDAAVKLPAAGATDFYGVAILTDRLIKARSGLGSASTVEYDDKDAVNVLRAGACWVYCEDAVSAGDAVFMRFQNAGAGEEVGSFRSDVDGGDAVAVTGAIFGKTITAAGLNWIEFRLP